MLSNLVKFISIFLFPLSSYTLEPCNEKTEFTCPRTNQCISLEWMCDGIADCQDGSDENNECKYLHDCLPGQFNCKDGECHGSLAKCDGILDCYNGRDELDCVPKQEEIDEKCTENEFRCADGYCIESYKRCDGEKNCLFDDDELDCDLMSKKSENDCDKMNCHYGCEETEQGATCTCPDEMRVNPEDALDCLPYNPCQEQYRCSHFCLPRMFDDAYKCSCKAGYVLDEDKRRCSPAEDPLGGDLIFTLGNQVLSTPLHRNATTGSKFKIHTIAETRKKFHDIAIDVRNDFFWVTVEDPDNNQWSIARIYQGEVQFLRHGYAEIKSLQFDWVNRNLFLITGGKTEIPAIRVCSADLIHCSKLLDGKSPIDYGNRSHHENEFRGLALHPVHGLICWIHSFLGLHRVNCANMDGSLEEVLTDNDLQTLTALVWHPIRDDLYIGDAGAKLIARINYDTREYKVIGRGESRSVMAFFNGILYYLEGDSKSISSIDVSIGQYFITRDDVNLTGQPLGLTIKHSLAQDRRDVESCPSTFDCQYVCVTTPRGPNKYKCLCPDGYSRDVNGTCSFQQDVRKRQNTSHLDLNYMNELCQNRLACGSNGECMYAIDQNTQEIKDIRCSCNPGYYGVSCEIQLVKQEQKTSSANFPGLFVVFSIFAMKNLILFHKFS